MSLARPSSPLQRRRLLGAAAATAWGSLLGAGLSGCSKSGEAPDPSPGPTITPRDDALRVAFVYEGQAWEGSWNAAHERGRKALEAALGDRVKVTQLDKQSDTPESEQALRTLVGGGQQLVFGTAPALMEPLLRMASEFSGIKFEHAAGFKTATNLRTYDVRSYESAYLAGVLAGRTTKSHILGVVAPVAVPEVIRNINAFTLGAQSVNPRIRTKVVWTYEWFNPPKETEATTSLVTQGADVLLQQSHSLAVAQTVEKLGRRVIGWDSSMAQVAPKAHLASAVVNWGPYYIKAAEDALEERWVSGRAWWGWREGMLDLVGMAADVPEDLQQLLRGLMGGLRDGTLPVWRGPIVNQEGREVVKAEEMLDDRALSAMHWYVRGVEGRVPPLP